MAWQVLAIMGGVLFVAFSFVIAFGAPYLPTLNSHVPQALDLLGLKPGQTLLELGSGDGRVLVAAAQKGLFAVGYEINPFLVFIAFWRTRKYKSKVKIIWGNYWNKTWPEADGIFVFLLQSYMEKLDKKITQEYRHPVKLVSFAFTVPGRKVAKEGSGLYLYKYSQKGKL